MGNMTAVHTEGKKGYHPEMDGDPLRVEKGWSHFRSEGEKDFLNRILAYRPIEGGMECQVETFRGKTALVRLKLVGESAFRFQMFPLEKIPEKLNEVFDFPAFPKTELTEDEECFTLRSSRVTLSVRKCPWEMTILLDGTELTREQIKDHNVDQKYKAIPVGFTTDENGQITDAFETMYLYCDESFYGFGEKFTDFNKRGQKITVWQRDAQSTNSDISYKGMPYFMSSTGYSILLNTYTRTHFNMGATSGVSYTMETEDAYLDYYMFCNRDYKGLIQDYTAFSGRSPMIPRWTFGFWMSKMSYRTREEVEDIAARMEAFGMSADVIHIDGWMGRSTAPNTTPELLAFDETRFPNPEEMIAELREKGLHLSLWMFPYVHAAAIHHPEKEAATDSKHLSDGQEKVASASQDGTTPNADSEMEEMKREFEKSAVALYERMKELDFLVKRPDGTPYIFSPGEGDAGGWGVAALDFTNPAFVAYMKERVKRLMKMGVGVIKTDFSEEIPEDAVFYDGSTGLESHNKYTLLYAKTIFEASQEAKEEMGEKALLWGRSGYAGSQNYPANWAGDSSASKNNLSAILNGGLSMGVSGVSFWGFDIGGFYNCDYEGTRTMPEDEEYIRSVQMGLMSPLSRSHGQSTPREPWNYSETAQKAFLTINKLRYRLLPYLYSTAYETHLDGVPMMRAMLLEFPQDLNVRNLSSQYMLGQSLLVAPVFDQQVHHIYLPAGSWIDFYTGERFETTDGRWIVSDKDINKIPLFLRENSILPMLAEAPMHIADECFRELNIIMNLTDRIEQHYYDDGAAATTDSSASSAEQLVTAADSSTNSAEQTAKTASDNTTLIAGSFSAVLQDGKLTITTKQMDIRQIEAYLPSAPEHAADLKASVNGETWKVRTAGNAVVIEKP